MVKSKISVLFGGLLLGASLGTAQAATVERVAATAPVVVAAQQAAPVTALFVFVRPPPRVPPRIPPRIPSRA